MKYQVRHSEASKAERRRLSPSTRSDVNAVVRRLRDGTDHRYDQKLVGYRYLWRARAGRRWRVVFALRPGREIVIRRIARREVAYDHLADLDY